MPYAMYGCTVQYVYNNVFCSMSFHEIVCSTQGLLMLLQNLPTIHWGNEEVGLLLAEAYRLKYMFADAPNHYKR